MYLLSSPIFLHGDSKISDVVSVTSALGSFVHQEQLFSLNIGLESNFGLGICYGFIESVTFHTELMSNCLLHQCTVRNHQRGTRPTFAAIKEMCCKEYEMLFRRVTLQSANVVH